MELTFTTVVRRALAAGAATGAVLGCYLVVVVEPVIGAAIAIEENRPTDGAHHASLFTRDEQTVGGVAAVVVVALLVSLIFGVVYARFRHRLPGRGDLERCLWLAATGFGTISLVPAIRYPADPPGGGDAATVDQRSGSYLLCLVVSVVAALALAVLADRLRARTDRATRILLVTLAALALYGTILAVLPPSPDSIPADVPAGLVWDFRLRSLGTLALLWTGVGLGTGWALERRTTPRRETAPSTVAAP